MQVVLVTDADMLKPLKDLARIPEDAITGVLYASSLLPHKRLHEHDAFYSPNGKIEGYVNIPSLATFTPAAHPLSNDGIINPAVQKAWFRLACGDWAALSQVASQAKKKGEVGDQAKILIERTEAYLTARKEAFDKRTIDLEAHVEGTKLADQLARSPAHKEASKALSDKLKSAAKDEPLKAEIVARSAYFKLVPMQISIKPSEQETAKGGYLQLAKKFPDAIYGRKAKVASDVMSAPSEQ